MLFRSHRRRTNRFYPKIADGFFGAKRSSKKYQASEIQLPAPQKRRGIFWRQALVKSMCTHAQCCASSTRSGATAPSTPAPSAYRSTLTNPNHTPVQRFQKCQNFYNESRIDEPSYEHAYNNSLCASRGATATRRAQNRGAMRCLV